MNNSSNIVNENNPAIKIISERYLLTCRGQNQVIPFRNFTTLQVAIEKSSPFDQGVFIFTPVYKWLQKEEDRKGSLVSLEEDINNLFLF
jgi:hypothetical protein